MVARFYFPVHFIKFLICKRVLINQVTYHNEKNSGNDTCEPQYCILRDVRVIGQFRVISIYRSADKRCQEHHYEDAEHQLQALVSLELLPHLAECDRLIWCCGDILLAALEAKHQENEADDGEDTGHREPGIWLNRQGRLFRGEVKSYPSHNQRSNPAGNGESCLEGYTCKRVYRSGRTVARAILGLGDNLRNERPHQRTHEQTYTCHHLGYLNDGVATRNIKELTNHEQHGKSYKTDGEKGVIKTFFAQPLLQNRH